MHERSGEGGHRLVRNLLAGAETEVRERRVGNVNPTGAARFLFAVNVFDIFRIIGRDFLRFCQEIVDVAEFHHVGRADGHTGGRLPFADAAGAHHALGDLRNRGVPFKFRDIERATDHAVPATDAVSRIVKHRSFRRFLERPRRTGRNAGRFLAVQALHFREPPHFAVVGVFDDRLVDHRPVVGGQLRRFTVCGCLVLDPLVVIVHLTCNRTASAADALRQVN